MPKLINYRKVKESDNLLLAKIIRGVFIEHNAPKHGTVYSDPTTDNLFELFKNPKSILWVAELDGVVIGCCGVYPTEGLPETTTELVKYYILKEARGLGIGKELMSRSVSSAKEFRFEKVYLESLDQFSKAVNIYKKLGFKRIDKFLGEPQHVTCDIWMIKEI
jgi:putative acetyltransferase